MIKSPTKVLEQAGIYGMLMAKDMRYLLISLFVYFLTIFMHLLFSRLKFSSKDQVNVLWLLGCLGAVFYWNGTAISPQGAQSLWSTPMRGSCLALYLLLLFPYYIFFTNANYDSPSQMIMVLLKKRGGCSREELLREMTPQRLIISRLDDLREEGFIGNEGGKYSLRPKGLWLMRFMKVYKNIIGREIHG